jgi:hypothetical protein
LQIVLAAGVALACIVLASTLVRAWVMRREQLLTWPGPRPRFHGLTLFIGVVFGVLVLVELLLLRRSPGYWVFDVTMVVYYGYLLPLAVRIRRGFYERGIWADGGYVAFNDIARLSWREDPGITLVVVRRTGAVRQLAVPQQFYAQARRLLRDRIKAHEIEFAPSALALGAHDDREDV